MSLTRRLSTTASVLAVCLAAASGTVFNGTANANTRASTPRVGLDRANTPRVNLTRPWRHGVPDAPVAPARHG